jgi:HPt (histidine-containing phosphotransfer) domain-containing protein
MNQSSIDLTVLKEFGAMMGDGSSDFIVELIDLFLEDTPDLLAGIEQNVAQKNAEGVRSTAHTLKSTAASVGAVKLSALSEQLEGIARSGMIENINGEVTELLAEFDTVKYLLKEEVMPALAI